MVKYSMEAKLTELKEHIKLKLTAVAQVRYLLRSSFVMLFGVFFLIKKNKTSPYVG